MKDNNATHQYEVDVTLLCYNHAKYLRQCLDSIIEQNTTFLFRIIIGDDCSSDGSQDIIMEYSKRYPNIIVPILNEHNVGVSQNSLQISLVATSKYVVGGESDDFFTDKNRLQKQYDFLELHHEYVAVGCNYYNVDPNGENPYRGMLKWQVNRAYKMNTFLRRGFVIHGNTIMRRNVFPVYDERYRELRLCVPTMGDVISRALLYDKGDIFCLPDVMHAHRMGLNDKASFFCQSRSNPIRYCYMYSTIVESLNRYFDYRYDFSPLITARVGLVLFWNVLGINQYNTIEFKEYMKTLPTKIQIYSYYRAINLMWRCLLHVIGRKLGL